MTKIFLSIIACLLFVISALAQSKPSNVGTWKLDLSQSDLGSEPVPKSVTITVFKDTPEMLSFRVDLVDAEGKASSISWSGPEDGTMHPTMQDGKAIYQQSAKKDADGAILRHGEIPDGPSFDARTTLSADGNTNTEEFSGKSPDGKQMKQKFVYHRVHGAAKAKD